MPLKGFIQFLNESDHDDLKWLWELGLIDAAEYYRSLPDAERSRLPRLQINLLVHESPDPHYDDSLIRESLENLALQLSSVWLDFDSYVFEPGSPGEPSWVGFQLYLEHYHDWTIRSLRDYLWDSIDGRIVSVELIPLGGLHLPPG